MKQHPKKEYLTQKQILEYAHQYNIAKRELLKMSMKIVNLSVNSDMRDLKTISMCKEYQNHLVAEMLGILRIVPLNKIKNYRVGI